MAYIAVVIISCFLAAWLGVGIFRNYAIKTGLLDHPNHRSSHTIPTPRGGGIIFWLLWLFVLVIGGYFQLWPMHIVWIFLPGALLIGLVGYLDDHFNLRRRWRLLAQFIAATIAMLTLGVLSHINLGIIILHLGWGEILLAIFAVIWSINLFNFMDGMDGMASLEALFIFGIGGLLLWLAQGKDLAILSWVVAASVAGFFMWNMPRAKIFMGDAGSTFLGFLVPVFALAGEKLYGVPALSWLILYSVFCFDASVTLVRRILAGHQWYKPHRLHAFQRLHISGWTHADVLRGLFVLNLFISTGVILAYIQPRLLIVWLGISVITLVIVYYLIERMQPMFSSLKGTDQDSA